jgi:hypothetical protein
MRWPRADGFPRRASALLSVGLALLWCTGHARATDGFTLEATCVAPAELIARVQSLLPEGVTAEGSLSGVEVRASAVAEEHSVEIALPAREDQPALSRTLHGESCESVIDAAIIVIGLWVAGQPAAPPPAPAPPPPPSPTAPAPRSQEPAQIALGLAFGVSLASELLPGLAIGLEAAGVVRWQELRLMLGVRGWPAQSMRLAAEPVIGAEASLVEGVLRIGALPLELGPLSVGASLALALGQLEARGLNPADSFEKTLLWVRSDLELSGRIALIRPLAVLFAAGVGVAWSRPVLSIAGLGTAFQPERLAPYAGVGVEALLE